MRTLLKVGFSLLMLALVLIGVSYSALRAQGLSSTSNPAGRVVASENREIGKGIMMVELSGPINLTVTQGATASLRLSGEQRLLANIVTSQEGGTLHIGTKGMMLHHRQPLRVELVLPNLEQFSVEGSGDSTVNGFSGDKLQLELHGSGNVIFNGRYRDITAGVHGSGDLELNGGSCESVKLELMGSGQMTVVGSTKVFKAEQTGSGDLDAQHLAADSVTLEQHGSGNSLVLAVRSADLTLNGSGDITVSGRPTQRNVNRNGSGDVIWED